MLLRSTNMFYVGIVRWQTGEDHLGPNTTDPGEDQRTHNPMAFRSILSHFLPATDAMRRIIHDEKLY